MIVLILGLQIMATRCQALVSHTHGLASHLCAGVSLVTSLFINQRCLVRHEWLLEGVASLKLVIEFHSVKLDLLLIDAFPLSPVFLAIGWMCWV